MGCIALLNPLLLFLAWCFYFLAFMRPWQHLSYSLITVCFYVIDTYIQAMVVAKLDDGLGTAPWLAVLVPYYLYEGALVMTWARI